MIKASRCLQKQLIVEQLTEPNWIFFDLQAGLTFCYDWPDK